jgi:hypothetical protein
MCAELCALTLSRIAGVVGRSSVSVVAMRAVVLADHEA